VTQCRAIDRSALLEEAAAEIERLRNGALSGCDTVRLTDAEREAVEIAVESYEEWLLDCGMEAMRESKARIATLRGLLERLG